MAEKSSELATNEKVVAQGVPELIRLRNEFKDPSTPPALRAALAEDVLKVEAVVDQATQMIANLQRELEDLENDFRFRGCS